jgi:hypothetical protein
MLPDPTLEPTILASTLSPSTDQTSVPPPDPAPTTAPDPAPTTAPDPKPTAVPVPAPDPEPTTAPDPEPTSAPAPAPTTVPAPAPTTVPALEPTSLPDDDNNDPGFARATPFSVSYDISGNSPGVTDFIAAGYLTLDYLEHAIYSFDNASYLDFSVIGRPLGNSAYSQIDYEISVEWTASSQTLMTTEYLDQVIMAALQQPEANRLVESLQNLPDQDPFSTCTDVSYAVYTGPSTLQSINAYNPIQHGKEKRSGNIFT